MTCGLSLLSFRSLPLSFDVMRDGCGINRALMSAGHALQSDFAQDPRGAPP
jgi:hypothetical protein